MPDAPVFQTLSQALAYITTPPSHYQLYLDDHECKIYRNRKPTQFHTANRVLVSREDGTIIESFPLVREKPPVQEEITQDVYDTIQLELERMGCQYLPDVSAPDGKIAVAVPAGIRDLGRTLTLPLTLLNDRLAKYGIEIGRKDRYMQKAPIEGQPEHTYLVFMPKPVN